MSSNVRFVQEERTMFGTKFGYAIEYSCVQEYGTPCVSFAENLLMPDDPQNWKKPLPIDLVSECIYELAKEKKQLVVRLYNRYVLFNSTDSCYEIKKRIRCIQISLIEIESRIPKDVKNYLSDGIFQLIKEMPVH